MSVTQDVLFPILEVSAHHTNPTPHHSLRLGAQGNISRYYHVM